MNKEVQKDYPNRYYYKCDRDAILLIFHCLIWNIIFFVSIFIVRKFFDIEDYVLYIKLANFIIFVLWILASSFSIFANTKKQLYIGVDEIIYTYGVFSKSMTSVPTSKIRSCCIVQSFTQRFFGSSDFSICTAGDSSEISFFDIAHGESAYKYIMSLIK